MSRRFARSLAVVVLAAACASCSRERSQPAAQAVAPQLSILLVTLDTTRADCVGYESDEVETPALDALAARGVRFASAWTTAPMTLPAHTSILTGLYPSEHGIHENSRFLGDDRVVLAERLRDAGYATAAFISGFPLERRFGLARGFDRYDDDFGEGADERRAGPTTDRALAYLKSHPQGPIFLWVHYYDPHEPYEPPEPFRSRYLSSPYLGEIAYMDRELGRLLDAFERRCAGGPSRILVVGDHGEGLGDHGELLHGNLLYRSVMRVPMIAAGSGIPAGRVDSAVSVRRVFDTVVGWAGLDSSFDLLAPEPEIVLAEAMKPYLQYGWQPQVMAVRDGIEVIRSGVTEVYDLRTDPAESVDLSREVEIDPEIAEAIRTYPIPAAGGGTSPPDGLDPEAEKRLAALGYASWKGPVAVRKDAPNPKDMTFLFADLDEGSRLFVAGRYEASIAVFDRVLAADPENLMVTLRLAVAHSVLGHEERALELFNRAEAIQPDSIDVDHYLAMHYFRYHHWDLAAPLLERELAVMPRRLPALQALARIREGEGRIGEAIALLERIVLVDDSPAADWAHLGELEMEVGDTAAAIRAFEEARRLQGDAFARDLELGVCYLDAARFADAGAALDRVPLDHPGYAMALFKRAQVSVLLGEPDWRERVRLAYEEADAGIRRLIENEPLFH